MKYIAIDHFIDKDNIPYYTGDIYPYSDIEVSDSHIESLITGNNALAKPLIKPNIVVNESVDENISNPVKYLEDEDNSDSAKYLEDEDNSDAVKDLEEGKEKIDEKPKRRKSTKSSKTETGDK